MATVAFLGSSLTLTPRRILETKSGLSQSILFSHFTVLIHFTNSVFWWIKDEFLFFGYQFLGLCLHSVSLLSLFSINFLSCNSEFHSEFFIYVSKHNKLSLEAVQLPDEKRKKGHLTWPQLSSNIAWIISLRAEIFTKPTKKKQNCLSIS